MPLCPDGVEEVFLARWRTGLLLPEPEAEHAGRGPFFLKTTDTLLGGARGGSVVAYLREHNAVVQEFAQTSEEYQALLDGKVDAVVQGSAGLDYYSAHEGKGLVKMVGPEFNKNDVGFVFPNDSRLRKKVNLALLSMREDGTYPRIYDNWFRAR